MHRDGPAAMSIDGRLDEVATIPATGFLRFSHRIGRLPPRTRARRSRCRVHCAVGNPTRLRSLAGCEL